LSCPGPVGAGPSRTRSTGGGCVRGLEAVISDIPVARFRVRSVGVVGQVNTHLFVGTAGGLGAASGPFDGLGAPAGRPGLPNHHEYEG
jgi:hypothetical protein